MLSPQVHSPGGPGANLAQASLLRKIASENVVILFLVPGQGLLGVMAGAELGSLIRLHFQIV